MVEIFIENIIASATLSDELFLEKVITTLPNCEYNPDRFPGVIFKPEDPHVVVLLFNTGKIMVTAAKSVNDVEKAITMVEKQLKKAGVISADGTAPKDAKEAAEEPGEEKEPDEEPSEEKEADEEPGEEKEADEEPGEEKEPDEEPGEEKEADEEPGEEKGKKKKGK